LGTTEGDRLGVENEVREGQENALVGEDISFLFTVIYFGTQVVTLVGFDPKLNSVEPPAFPSRLTINRFLGRQKTFRAFPFFTLAPVLVSSLVQSVARESSQPNPNRPNPNAKENARRESLSWVAPNKAPSEIHLGFTKYEELRTSGQRFFCRDSLRVMDQAQYYSR
jgi:hypothetical protein